MSRPRRRAAPWPALLLAPILLGWSFFDPFHRHVEQGNAKARKGDTPDAVEEYDRAAAVNRSSPIPDFNKGVAFAGSGDAEAARNALLAAASSPDAGIAADALYNLGNVYLNERRFGEAVESYLKSLDLDPQDADARRNLEIALRRLEEQQQQPQPQQQEQQDRQEQPQDRSEGGDESPPPDEQERGDESRPEEPTPQEPEAAPEEKFSREDAERLLNAIRGDEMKLLDRLRRRDPEKEPATNDW